MTPFHIRERYFSRAQRHWPPHIEMPGMRMPSISICGGQCRCAREK